MLFVPGGDKEKQASNQTNPATEKETTSKDQSDAPQQSTADPINPINMTERKVRKGHGRLAAAKYTGAKRVVCRDDNLFYFSSCGWV